MTKTHKNTDKLWTDESGMQIPVTRVRASEKFRERAAGSLHQKAISINKQLLDFKNLLEEASKNVHAYILKDNKIEKDTSKGNFTWYNFDRSIKIEVSVNERIEFDEALISMCKSKLDEFITANLNGVDTFVKELINDAFQNTKGKLDSKKVMSLLKHRSKIKDQRYQDAMELLEKSIRRPDSKTYYRVWEKDAKGEYQNINLNFSSI